MAKAKKKVVATQEQADEMIENGSAEIPDQAIIQKEIAKENNDYNNHPKFDKFKNQGSSPL